MAVAKLKLSRQMNPPPNQASGVEPIYTAEGGSQTASLLSDIDEKDTRARVEKFRRWYEDSFKAHRPWRDAAETSYKMISGDQWDERDIARKRERNEAALTINKILNPISFLEGMQRQQRRSPKLLPVEGGDVGATEVMQSLVTHVATYNSEDVIDSWVWRDTLVAGMGAWKVGISYDDIVDGEVVWEAIHPLSVYPDPNWVNDGNFKNCRYIIQANWYELEEAIERWPKFEAQIRARFGHWKEQGVATTNSVSDSAQATSGEDAFQSQRTWWDPENQRLRCIEVWYLRRTEVKYALVEGQEPITDPDMVASIGDLVKRVPEAKAQVTLAKRTVKRCYLAHVLDEILLDDEKSPYDCPELPIFLNPAYQYRRLPFSPVDVLKDPQREKNVRRSKIIDAWRFGAKNAYFNHKSQGAKTEEIEQMAEGMATVVNHAGVPPERVPAPELPQILIYLEQKADMETDQLISVAAARGQLQPRSASGRAMDVRARGEMMTQEPLLDAFQKTKRDATKFSIRLIQQVYTPSKALRVIGQQAQRAKNPADPSAMLAQQPPDMIDVALSTAFTTDFDVVVDDAPWQPTNPAAKWSTLLELFQTFGQYIPPQVLVEVAKDNMLVTEDQANEILQYVQQQQAAQQAQQMQHAAAQQTPPNVPPIPPEMMGG